MGFWAIVRRVLVALVCVAAIYVWVLSLMLLTARG